MRRELPPYPPPPVMVLRKASLVLRKNLSNLLIIGLTVCCFPLAELYQLLTFFFLILLDQLVSRATPSPPLLPVLLSSTTLVFPTIQVTAWPGRALRMLPNLAPGSVLMAQCP